MIRVVEVDRLFRETIITGNDRKTDLHALQRSDGSAEGDRGGGEGFFFFFRSRKQRGGSAVWQRTSGKPFFCLK